MEWEIGGKIRAVIMAIVFLSFIFPFWAAVSPYIKFPPEWAWLVTLFLVALFVFFAYRIYREWKL